MRTINYIVVHCSATHQNATIESIQRYWRDNLGWKSPGYHYIIKANGDIVNLLDLGKPSNGVSGYNSVSVHICYIGGIDTTGKPCDNRTSAQKASIVFLLEKLRDKYPSAVIRGHRDFPAVKKACPCFDAKTEYAKL